MTMDRAEAEFQDIDLGDERRNRRAMRLEEARTCISKAWGLYKDARIGQYDEFFRQLLEEVKQLVDARQNDS
jgi:hypothetical protein